MNSKLYLRDKQNDISVVLLKEERSCSPDTSQLRDFVVRLIVSFLHYDSILALLASPAPRAQQITLPEEVRTAAGRIAADQLAWDLDYLASDALLGRNTPSRGYGLAAEYIVKRLEKAGLKPFGDNDSFLQSYSMRETHVDTGSAYLEVGGERFRIGDDFVMRTYTEKDPLM